MRQNADIRDWTVQHRAVDAGIYRTVQRQYEQLAQSAQALSPTDRSEFARVTAQTVQETRAKLALLAQVVRTMDEVIAFIDEEPSDHR